MLQGFLTRSTIGTDLCRGVEGGASPTTSMVLPIQLSTIKFTPYIPMPKGRGFTALSGKPIGLG